MEIALGILGQTAMLLHGKVDVKWAHPRSRQVLAALLTSPNQRFPVDAVVDWVWAEHENAPRGALATLHQNAVHLRQALQKSGIPARIGVGKHGCVVEIDEALVDHRLFSRLMARARELRDRGDHRRAQIEAQAAVRLWRDDPLADLPTQRADDWRAQWMRGHWLPANAFLVAELLAVGHGDVALGRLLELEHAHPLELGLAKLRLRALAATDRPDEVTEFYFAKRRQYLDVGELRAADELRAVHDEVISGDGGFPRQVVRMRAVDVEEPAGQPVWHVPPDGDGIEGRAELLAELDAFTSDSSGASRRGVVVVTGGPGVGKSTAVVRWVHRARRRFPHGAVLLDLRGDGQAASANSGEVVDTLLSLLDFPVGQVVSPVARAAKLSGLLQRRPMLVVLDNVDSREQIAPLLGVLDACTVLVVSRWRLPSLAATVSPPVVTVPPLTEQDATALLDRRIGRRAREDRDGVAELVRVCQGNPLALTLVADRAAARTGLLLSTLAGQLRDADMLLDLGYEGDALQRSLRAAFTASYQVLGPGERRAFAVIGVHPGAEVTTEAVAAGDGRPLPAVRRSLDVLVAAHLLEHPSDLDRYRVHDLLHAYAASVAGQLADVAEVRCRLFDFHLQMAYEAHRLVFPYKPPPQLPATRTRPGAGFGSAALARQWVVREKNVLLEIAAAGGAESAYLPALFAELITEMGFYADAVNCLTVAISRVEEVLAEGGDSAPQLRQVLGSHLNDLAVVLMHMGEEPRAEHHLRRALALAEADGFPLGRLVSTLNLARWHLRVGRAPEAAVLCRLALQLADELNEPSLCAAAAHRLANALVAAGGFEQEALDLYAEALEHLWESGDRTARLQIHTALGALLTDLGRLNEADEQCRLAAELTPACLNLPAVMKLNTVLARLRHQQGNARAALWYAHRAVELADRTRHATGQARALSTLAVILRDHGNREDARALWVQAAELYRGRARTRRAAEIEELVAELDASEPIIPAARDGERDTVAMLPPRLRRNRQTSPDTAFPSRGRSGSATEDA
ncbi:BTAD domain-containing putative transcriptional regulator [Amycolatopsis sp. NPDC051716]|uniref:AfsR/SARP family transcriptional regulator n=1 Tax=Amycolatopsis sp. NPDC051716 TaxID=3155804 RepID=UPI0034228F22